MDCQATRATQDCQVTQEHLVTRAGLVLMDYLATQASLEHLDTQGSLVFGLTM
jgi:hypothetical protein